MGALARFEVYKSLQAEATVLRPSRDRWRRFRMGLGRLAGRRRTEERHGLLGE
jgi:hypothetical protein